MCSFTVENNVSGVFPSHAIHQPVVRVSRLVTIPMLQFLNFVNRRMAPVLLLVLLSACSQADSGQRDRIASVESTDPQAEQTPVESAKPAANPKTATPSPIAKAPSRRSEATPPSESSSKPRSSSTTAAVPKPGAAETPTFKATQRLAGFSADGSHYLYLESSRDTGAGIPKSSIQVIDVTANACAENGCKETRYGEADADLKTTDAEQDLLQQTWKTRQALNLTPPVAGTELSIVSRSRTPDGTETVTVRLPKRDQPLQLRLKQKQLNASTSGKAESDKAAMQLEVVYDGESRSLDSLSNFREWVLSYSIREVRLSADGKHVAVLLTATKPTFEGTLATTLVQGFEL